MEWKQNGMENEIILSGHLKSNVSVPKWHSKWQLNDNFVVVRPDVKIKNSPNLPKEYPKSTQKQSFSE